VTTVDNVPAPAPSTTRIVVAKRPRKPATNERSLSPAEAETAQPRTRIVAYARVSTDKQADYGVSLEAQTRKFEAYAVAHDAELVEVVSDSLSGKDTKRPALQRALAMLEGGKADGLLVAKLDRLTRNVRDSEDLVERYFTKRFALLSVGDSIDTRSAGGRFVLRLMTCVAQWERETISERTKDALAHVRAEGGGVPRLEGLGAARVVELAAAGLSLRAIATQLTEEGVPTLKGGRWAPETVRKVLARAGAHASVK
jgi:site-specific DNA recombinase